MRKKLFLLMLVILLSLVTYYVVMDRIVRVEVTPEEFRDHQDGIEAYRFETYGHVTFSSRRNSDWDDYDFRHTMKTDTGQTYTLYMKKRVDDADLVIHGKLDQMGSDQGTIEVSNYWTYTIPPKYKYTYQEQMDLIIYEWLVIIGIILCSILTLITVKMKSAKKPKKYAGRMLYVHESDDNDNRNYMDKQLEKMRKDPSHISIRSFSGDRMVLTMEEEMRQVGVGKFEKRHKLVTKSEKKIHQEMDDKFDSMFESLEI